jgi:hypothetical protein
MMLQVENKNALKPTQIDLATFLTGTQIVVQPQVERSLCQYTPHLVNMAGAGTDTELNGDSIRVSEFSSKCVY